MERGNPADALAAAAASGAPFFHFLRRGEFLSFFTWRRRLSPPPVAAGHRRHAAKPMQPELVPGLDDDDGLTRPGAKRVRLWRDRTPEGAFPPSCLLLLPTVDPND